MNGRPLTEGSTGWINFLNLVPSKDEHIRQAFAVYFIPLHNFVFQHALSNDDENQEYAEVSFPGLIQF